MADSDIRDAERLLRTHLLGRPVTRILLDYQVTFQFDEKPLPLAELKLELPFQFSVADGSESTIQPSQLGPGANELWHLFTRRIQDLEIDANCALHLRFGDGSALTAQPGDYESWSFVAGHERVVCLSTPNGLALWTNAHSAPSGD